ncbi:unnamed protein product [Rhizophagus irregularis]|uniref:Uncharacterized protein n=1 Tax=Rhizophagus irregularis TaxID=588596 RepID=A0A915ZXH8_9GLOM|nr:unnamed protein product [Rhizophagus irregularis]
MEPSTAVDKVNVYVSPSHNAKVCHNKVVASTPFSNDWQYLDNFWTYQFLYATKLQLDKENFVTLKKR